jgi:DNA-binding CsgD family transcriptional regulator/PAS domain-containing protein
VLRPPAQGDAGVILNSLRPDPKQENPEDSLASPADWELTAYREHFFSLDPFVNLPPGQVITLDDLLPEPELIASDYYQHYLQPVDLFRILGVDTIEPGGMLARLRFSRRRSEPCFGDRDRQLLTLVTPHLQRATEVYAKLSRTTSERDTYAQAVDQLSVATIILDEQGKLLNHNSVGEALLEEADGLYLHNLQLRIKNLDINQKLQDAIERVVEAQQRGAASIVRALRVPRSTGRADLGMVIRPVATSQWNEGQSSPCVALFISDPDLRESASQQILTDLFNLTPAEANLAILLARGLNLAEVSQTQEISQHTARAQLKSIFAKTGVSRQAELVRLILKSVASLG